MDDRPARLALYNFLLRGGLKILEQYNLFIELIYISFKHDLIFLNLKSWEVLPKEKDTVSGGSGQRF